MTPEQQAILNILEDSKLVCYQKSPVYPKEGEYFSYSAVLCIFPTCIDKIKMLWNSPINDEI